MPTVPRRGTGYVPTRQTPSVSPGNAFQPAQPVDIGPAARQLAQIIERHKQRADEVAWLEADNKLAQISADLETQTLEKRGREALEAGAQVQDQWRKASSEIEGSLTTDTQRENFRISSERRWTQLNTTVQRHGIAEFEKYDAAQTDAGLNSRAEQAIHNYSDPKQIEDAVTESKGLVQLFGSHHGWSPEQIADKQLAATSRIHTGVINQLLADDRDIDATKYFEAHSGELDAKSLIQAKDSLDLGSVRGESQRRSDSIVAQSATLGGALQEAAKITDPKLREATEGRIRRHFEDASASQRLEREQAYQQAGVILEQTGDIHKIPAAIWLKLSPPERNELQYRQAQRRNPARATNWDTYNSLMNMAGLNDSTRQQFEQLDLSRYRDQLADAEYNRLLSLQLGERRQTTGALSGEAKRQAGVAERAAAKDEQRKRSIQLLRDMGIDMPEPPKVPGAPLRTPTVQLKASPKGKQVPQRWIDRASKDENYKRYLEHMGVVFDSAFSAPTNPRDNGNITLR